MLGNKIVVVGVSASGKSTFARKLAAKTHLPLTHMDAIMWEPCWQYVGDEVTKAKLQEVISKDKWLLEGFLEKDWLHDVLQKADSIIYLDYSSWTLLWRYVYRSWKHGRNPRPEIPECPDTFSLKFLIRILKRKEMYWPEREIASHNYDVKLTILKSPRQAKQFLKTV